MKWIRGFFVRLAFRRQCFWAFFSAEARKASEHGLLRHLIRQSLGEDGSYAKAGLPRRKELKAGQAMTEYVIVAGMLTAAVAILAVFLYTFKEYGGRVLDLVSSDYP